MSFICVFTFLFTTPADSKTLLRWLTDLGSQISNRMSACKNSFDETAATKPTRVSPQTIRLKSQKPKTDFAEESHAQFIVNSENKIIGIFKADSYETSPPHEVAAYELCLAIGCRVVPKTGYILFNTKTELFQEVTETDLKNYTFIQRFIQASVRNLTRPQSSWNPLDLKTSTETQKEINALLESHKSRGTKMGSLQVFKEGTPRSQLNEYPPDSNTSTKTQEEMSTMLESPKSRNTETRSLQAFEEGTPNEHSSDFRTYMELLKDSDSSIRRDFDEMAVFDLITGSNSRNFSNYIIDINEGRLYAINNSENFETSPLPVINWVFDAKKAQIWQTPLSYRMRQLIMGINFSKIEPILQKHHFSSTQKKHIQQRVRKLQSIVEGNPEATLEDIVMGMGGFNKPLFLVL